VISVSGDFVLDLGLICPSVTNHVCRDNVEVLGVCTEIARVRFSVSARPVQKEQQGLGCGAGC
jgi:hypothetical protein